MASVLASALACSVAPLVLEPMETCAGVTLVGAVFAGVDPVVDAGVVAGAPVVLAACSEPLLMPWVGAWVGAFMLTPTAGVGADAVDA